MAKKGAKIVYWLLAGNRFLVVIAGVAIAISIFLGGCSNARVGSLASDFELTDQRGQTVSLEDLSGRPVVLTFVYTHCPDVCPLYLSRIRQALAGLEIPDKGISVIVVTVDPERDTVEHLERFAGSWPANWHFLTGRSAKVARVWSDYGIHVERDGVGALYAAANGYGVVHTGKVVVLDRDSYIATELVGNWSTTQLGDVVGQVLVGKKVVQRTGPLEIFARLLERCGDFASAHPWAFIGLMFLIMLPGLVLPAFLLRTFLRTKQG
ncbi:MAG: SCO family protein [SAR202 cluster bacterium]|nr:SCO family protein [SAR202 cluster bacterium]